MLHPRDLKMLLDPLMILSILQVEMSTPLPAIEKQLIVNQNFDVSIVL
jgi:hypothetical protein